MKSINLLALPGATEFDPTTTPQEDDNATRVARAMHGLLDDYAKSDGRLTEYAKENPMLYAHNIGRPALVGVLRAQAGHMLDGEEPESWRLLLNRFSGQEPASMVMSYTVYLGSNRGMDNGLDVRILGSQLYAGNGGLADPQIKNMPVNIAEVPGVADAITEDLALLREQNGL
jgi:hypothetical protein